MDLSLEKRRFAPLKRSDIRYDATIQFKDVHFEGPTHPDTPVIRGINLTIRSGEIVAVAGMSGQRMFLSFIYMRWIASWISLISACLVGL